MPREDRSSAISVERNLAIELLCSDTGAFIMTGRSLGVMSVGRVSLSSTTCEDTCGSMLGKDGSGATSAGRDFVRNRISDGTLRFIRGDKRSSVRFARERLAADILGLCAKKSIGKLNGCILW